MYNKQVNSPEGQSSAAYVKRQALTTNMFLSLSSASSPLFVAGTNSHEDDVWDDDKTNTWWIAWTLLGNALKSKCEIVKTWCEPCSSVPETKGIPQVTTVPAKTVGTLTLQFFVTLHIPDLHFDATVDVDLGPDPHQSFRLVWDSSHNFRKQLIHK